MHLEALVVIGTLTIVLGALLYSLHVFLMQRLRRRKPDDPRLKVIASMSLVITSIVAAGIAVGLLAVGSTSTEGLLARLASTSHGRYGIFVGSFILTFVISYLLGFKLTVRGPQDGDEDAS